MWHFRNQDRQCTYKRTIKTRSCNHCCRGINKHYIFCVSVALITQHAKRMHRVVLSLVACPALQHFPTLSHKWYSFRKKKVIEHKYVFWFSLQLLSEIFLILKRIERDMYICLHAKYLVFLSDFNETWISSTDFREHSNIKFHENPSSGSRVVPCGWTDRCEEANSRFSKFCDRA
jgi:hypothetical protein